MACRWRKECLVACSGFRRWLGENTHLSVCFVSGYLGFSAGRLTRGVPSMSAGLKMEVCLSTTISGTLVPPKRIGVRKPATWKPVSSIPLADSSVSRALAVAARAAARAKRRGAREEKLSRRRGRSAKRNARDRQGAGPPAPLRVRAPGLVPNKSQPRTGDTREPDPIGRGCARARALPSPMLRSPITHVTLSHGARVVQPVWRVHIGQRLKARKKELTRERERYRSCTKRAEVHTHPSSRSHASRDGLAESRKRDDSRSVG